MTKHVFVIGLDDFNLAELKTVHNAGEYTFHGLVDYDTMVNPPSYPMDAIMAEARETLKNAPSVDAIIGHWDFPTTSMLPILRREWGLPTPSLESVLYCENKYWNRLAGEQALPECTPDFQGLDPYSDDPVRDLDMAYPFWLKPSVAFSSYLGFRIENEQQYLQAMETIRDNIHVFAEPFDNVMQYSTNRGALPDRGSGATCIAEGLISGRLCTLEGYVHDGEVVVYAIVDSLRASNNVSFFSYQYPSHLPVGVRNRMVGHADTILRHIGMDHSPFNQDSYSFEIAYVFIGAESEEALHEKFRHIMEVLDFQFADVVPTNYN